MQATNPDRTETTSPPEDAEPRRRSRPWRAMELLGTFIGIAALVLLIAAWVTAPAGAAGDSADVSYEQCVEAALSALGPTVEASSDGSLPDSVDQVDPAKSQQAGGGATVLDTPDGDGVHPNSPAHEMCTEDCAEDEQCPRPTEFTVVRDDSVETISFENPEPEGDSAV